MIDKKSNMERVIALAFMAVLVTAFIVSFSIEAMAQPTLKQYRLSRIDFFTACANKALDIDGVNCILKYRRSSSSEYELLSDTDRVAITTYPYPAYSWVEVGNLDKYTPEALGLIGFIRREALSDGCIRYVRCTDFMILDVYYMYDGQRVTLMKVNKYCR